MADLTSMAPKNGNINKQFFDAKFVDLFSTLSNFVSNSLARNYITGLFYSSWQISTPDFQQETFYLNPAIC